MHTDLTKSQLAAILSALDGKPRRPASKPEAVAAITKTAGRIGLSADDVFAAADGLLDGRLDAAA